MFTPGLKLIDVGYAEIKPTGPSLNAPLGRTVTLKVPKESKFVHVAVTTLDMSFVAAGNTVPSTLGSIWFEITNRDDSQLGNGIFKFDLRAVLQRTSDQANPGEWTGVFWVEFMCFG